MTIRTLGLDLLLVLVVLGGVHLAKLRVLPLRGEESRWATVSSEMQRTGDWIVPRQQGEPFLSRPPMGSWLIGLSVAVVGETSPFSVRLPSALATLALGLLLYAYGRTTTGSRIVGLVAAIGYGTMGHVLQLGRLAESEAVFTAMLAGALLGWHLLRTIGAPAVLGWCVGYGLAALAALTKGPQAPAYFLGGVGLYLLWRREWRDLIRGSHFVGLATFAAILLAWQIPFALRAGTGSIRAIWSGDTMLRFEQLSLMSWIRHLAEYPIEVLTCMAPWSLLLAVYGARSIRQELGASRDAAVFAACAVLPALVSCWLVPNARGRYFMPLYPLVAVLAGIAADRLIRAESDPYARRAWRRFATFGAVATSLATLGALVVQFIPSHRLVSYQQPAVVIAVYVVGGLVATAILFRSSRGISPKRGLAGCIALAGFLGLTGTYLGIDVNLKASEDTGGAVARLKAEIGEETRLVSFGVVHHLFAYYYERPIEQRARLASQLDDPELDYFCFDRLEGGAPEPTFPFAWERLAEVSNERYRRDDPRFVTVVGRRVREAGAAVADGSRRVPAR